MTKTILIALALIAGILAFMYLSPTRHEPSPPTQKLLGMGQFVVEQNGNPIITEDYTLVYTEEEGYILISQAKLAQGEKKVTFAQQYQLTPEFSLSFYQLGVDTQTASQIVSVQPKGTGIHMEVRSDEQVHARDIPDRRGTFILDNNLVSQYQLLLLAAETEALDRDFTALVPQALLSLPAHLDGPNQVTFNSGGKNYDGKRFTLKLGDLVITILTYKGHLVGLFNPAQGVSAYNKTLFPDGVSYTASEPQGLLFPRLRDDKRGVGKLEGDFATASMEGLLVDARAALSALRSTEGIDPNRIFVLGHSKGGIIGPILAAENPVSRSIRG